MIPGAITKTEFAARAEQHRDRRIMTYCTIGYRSGVYASELRRDSFDAVNLKGGVLGWAHAGGTFIDSDGRETRRVHVYGAKWDLLPDAYSSDY